MYQTNHASRQQFFTSFISASNNIAPEIGAMTEWQYIYYQQKFHHPFLRQIFRLWLCMQIFCRSLIIYCLTAHFMMTNVKNVHVYEIKRCFKLAPKPCCWSRWNTGGITWTLTENRLPFWSTLTTHRYPHFHNLFLYSLELSNLF